MWYNKISICQPFSIKFALSRDVNIIHRVSKRNQVHSNIKTYLKKLACHENLINYVIFIRLPVDMTVVNDYKAKPTVGKMVKGKILGEENGVTYSLHKERWLVSLERKHRRLAWTRLINRTGRKSRRQAAEYNRHLSIADSQTPVYNRQLSKADGCLKQTIVYNRHTSIIDTCL